MFGYLLIEKNIGWFKQILSHTMPIEQEPTSVHDISVHIKLNSINPKLARKHLRILRCLLIALFAVVLQSYCINLDMVLH